MLQVRSRSQSNTFIRKSAIAYGALPRIDVNYYHHISAIVRRSRQLIVRYAAATQCIVARRTTQASAPHAAAVIRIWIRARAR
jgi:hypothetical protein